MHTAQEKSLIKAILAISGPMPDSKAHARWLGTLRPEALQKRLQCLTDEKDRHLKQQK